MLPSFSSFSFARAFKGHLVGVIGKVGSGKSSLLSTITAEMDKIKGQVSDSLHPRSASFHSR